MAEFRQLGAEALARLEQYSDLDLTYTSNAIEGNSLSRVEVALVVVKGMTIAGKPLRDHLEALDHFDAIRYVREFGRSESPLIEAVIRSLHKLVMRRSQPETAGHYTEVSRYVRTDTGRHEFPSPAEIPSLMRDLAAWLVAADSTPETAFTAHRKLVDIHPFHDGNGRTARLLMNLILIRAGYPPVAVRPEDRLEYTRALAAGQSGNGRVAFEQLMYRRLESTLSEYLDMAGNG